MLLVVSLWLIALGLWRRTCMAAWLLLSCAAGMDAAACTSRPAPVVVPVAGSGGYGAAQIAQVDAGGAQPFSDGGNRLPGPRDGGGAPPRFDGQVTPLKTDAKDSSTDISGADATTEPPLEAPEPVAPCGMEVDGQDAPIVPAYETASPAQVRPVTGDPGAMGPNPVVTINVDIPNPDGAGAALEATWYMPTSSSSERPVRDALPFVLVMHGYSTNHFLYEHYSKHFASHGLATLGLTLPFALTADHDLNTTQALAAIDYALGETVPEEIAGRIGAGRIAVTGHSFGGKIAFSAAARDPRIGLVIGWDPSNAGGPPCFVDMALCHGYPVAPNCDVQSSGLMHNQRAASLIFRAAPDLANPEPSHNALHFFRGAPPPATLIDSEDRITHGDFASPTASIVPHTLRVSTAWLVGHLAAQPSGLEAWLWNGSRLGDDPLVVRVLSK